MSSWDGRCLDCRRLMSTCSCHLDQNSHPNGLTSSAGADSDLFRPMRTEHGKRHLLETLKQRHPVRAQVLLPLDTDAHLQPPSRKLSVAYTNSSSRRREPTSLRSRPPTPGVPSSSSSSVPVVSSHLARSSAAIHRNSAPVPHRPSGAVAYASSRSDPAAIREHQAHSRSVRSSKPSSSSSSRGDRMASSRRPANDHDDDVDFSLVFEL